MSRDPKRLVAGNDALASAILATREHVPSSERLAAMAARLAAAGAPVEDSPPPLHAVAPEPERRRKLHLVRLLEPGTLAVIAALLGGGALVAGAISLRGDDTPAVLVVPGPTPPEEQVRGPALGSAAQPGRGEATPNPPLDGAGDRPAAGAPPTLLSSPAPRDVGRFPDEAPPPSKPAGAALPPSSTTAARDPAPRATTSARSREANRTGTGGLGAPLAESTVVLTEVELLKKARSALGADAIEAFALTERCRAQYPAGSFAQEREYIAIVALYRLGRTDEARSRATLFRMHHANSAYLPRLARMLGQE